MLKTNKQSKTQPHNIKDYDPSNSIEIRNLKKYYISKKYINEIKAIDDISFQVKKGEFFGLLGPNGAGKTTIINILSGLTIATSGSAIVGGFNIRSDSYKVKQLIGRLMPSYYVVDALKLIFKGTTLTDLNIWIDLVVISIISTVLILIGIQLFKRYGNT